MTMVRDYGEVVGWYGYDTPGRFLPYNVEHSRIGDQRAYAADIALNRPWAPVGTLGLDDLVAELQTSSMLAVRALAEGRLSHAQEYLMRADELEAELKARP